MFVSATSASAADLLGACCLGLVRRPLTRLQYANCTDAHFSVRLSVRLYLIPTCKVVIQERKYMLDGNFTFS